MSSLFTTLRSAEEMSLREKIAQLIFVRIGSNLPPIRTVEQDEERIARLLERCPVGGLLLFNGGQETKPALERLQQRSAVPLLVASDIERGVGQQVKGYTLFPHAMAFEKLGANAETVVAEFARLLAREARVIGIHITFGPVADVNTNPRNPIIATRAFSETPNRAAALTRAYVVAAEGAGLRTAAKHFPGHGDTHQDSHDSLPNVGRSMSELQACELVPFQAAIDAGCGLVMTAHVSYPAIDSSGAPATLSPIILRDVLRKQMKFGGVVCSDSLLMAGVRDLFADEQEMALAALMAGVDLLLDLNEPAEVVEYLCDCVISGRLEASRVEEAFERVWALKQSVFANRANGSTPKPDAPPNSASLAERVARDAIELRHVCHPTLPLDPGKSLGAILLKPFETPIDPLEQPLAAALRERFGDVKYAQIGPKSDVAAYGAAGDLAREAEQLIVAMIVRPAAWHAFGLRPEQKEFVYRLLRDRKDVVLASLGVPYALQDFPGAAASICTYSDVPVSQRALAEFLLK
jgi:beta-glucosidase-like glycosyl hydrolase